MKLFGTLSELVATVFRKNSQPVTLRPNQATTYTAARDIQLPQGDTDHVLVSRTSTDTLTNKTISGASNTVTNVSLTTGVTGTLPAANGGTGITSLGAGIPTFLGTPSSANLASAVTDETGTGALVFATSPVLVTPALGTPSSGVLTNTTGLPLTTGVTGILPTANGGTGQNSTATFPTSGVVSTDNGTATLSNKTISGSNNTITNVSLTTGVTGTLPEGNGGTGLTALASGMATFLGTATSLNLKNTVTDETGSGALVFATSPTLVTPALGTPSSGTLTNTTGLPIDGGTTGTLPISRGGTGQTTQTAAFNALDPLTTKGDLITNNGTDSIRFAAGANGTVLTSDSAQTSGLSWTTPLTNPMTSVGDLIVGGTAGAATRLAVGTANQILSVNTGGTTEEWRTLVAGTAGTDFAVAFAAGTTTLNLPDASATARGLITTGTQTVAGAKTFSTSVTSPALAATSTISETVTDNSTTGIINNLAWTSGVIRFTGTADTVLRGVVGQANGTWLTVINDMSAGKILTVQYNRSDTSTNVNCFATPDQDNGILVLPNLATAMFRYSPNTASGGFRWMLVSKTTTTQSRIIVSGGQSATANGTTSTRTRYFITTPQSNFGNQDITYATSATAGSTFTINTASVYAMTYCDRSDTGNDLAIVKNSGGATNPGSETAGNVLACTDLAAGTFSSCSATVYLVAGDVIRATNNNAGTFIQTDPRVLFSIQKVN